MTSISTSLTPPEVASQWRVSSEKVIAFIKSGSLRAFDVSNAGSTRPRYRIPLDAIVEFEESHSARQPVYGIPLDAFGEFESRRSAMAAPKPVRRKRRKKDSDFVQYF